MDIDPFDPHSLKISKTAANYRLQSIPESFIPQMPWLQHMVGQESYDLQCAAPINPNLIHVKADTPASADPPAPGDFVVADVSKELSADLSEDDRVSDPILASRLAADLPGESIIMDASPCFPIRYLRLHRVSFSRLSPNSVCDIFVYTDRPVCEPARRNVSEDPTLFWVTSCDTAGATGINLPFPYDLENARVVAIIYMCSPAQGNDGSLRQPIALGHHRMPAVGYKGTLELIWERFDSKQALASHFVDESNFASMSCTFECEVVAVPGPGRVAKLAPFDPMFPTPLLTISDISIAWKKVDKTKSGKLLSLLFAVKAECGEKEPVTCVTGVEPGPGKARKFLRTSQVTPSAKMVYPDVLTFRLAPDIPDGPFVLHIHLVQGENRKAGHMRSCAVQITKPSDFVRAGLTKDRLGKKCDEFLTFRYMFPTVAHPPGSCLPALNTVNGPAQLDSPFYTELATYAVSYQLAEDRLATASFAQLVGYLPSKSPIFVSIFLNWITHHMGAKPGFSAVYMKRLADSLAAVAGQPEPFFAMVLKSLTVDNAINATAFNYFVQAVIAYQDANTPGIRTCLVDLLVDLSKALDDPIVLRYLHTFLRAMPEDVRWGFFTRIWKDLPFVHSLVPRVAAVAQLTVPVSPFIPLFSLFFCGLNQAFLDNKAETIRLVVAPLLTLCATIELFSSAAVGKRVGIALFPLLPMIFTFYDSLASQTDDPAVLSPPVLCILKHSTPNMFRQYWRFLTSDNQFRFLDLLVNLASPRLVLSLALSALDMQEQQSACSDEVTQRIISFMTHIDYANTEPRTASRLYNILIEMLHQPEQTLSSFRNIFRTMMFFVKEHRQLIFKESSTLILTLVKAVLPLTQRPVTKVNEYALAFVHFLIDAETEANGNFARCTFGLQYALIDTFFQTDNFRSFLSHLPGPIAPVQRLEADLLKTRSSSRDVLVGEFLRIYPKYRAFPSIRAKIYEHIVSLNEAARDYLAAFVTQWRLCAIIAEVFRVRGTRVAGVANLGFASFPYIFDEPPIDLSGLSADAVLFVTESEMFTVEYFAAAMQKALELCGRANLNRIVRTVTENLFDYLEVKREYSLLTKLYDVVMLAYDQLTQSEGLGIEFALDSAGGEERITVKTVAGEERIGLLAALTDAGRRSTADQETGQKVSCAREDLMNLKVSNFSKDEFKAPDCDWKQVYAMRTHYETEYPLPHISSVAVVKSSRVEQITKKDFYVKKLREFYDNLQAMITSIEAVLPPEKYRPLWPQCPLGMNTHPVLVEMGKVLEPSNEPENAPFAFVLSEHTADPTPDLDSELLAISDDTWDLLYDSISVLDYTQNLNKPEQVDQESLVKFSRILQCPLIHRKQ
jgi:hypothetical protein